MQEGEVPYDLNVACEWGGVAEPYQLKQAWARSSLW